MQSIPLPIMSPLTILLNFYTPTMQSIPLPIMSPLTISYKLLYTYYAVYTSTYNVSINYLILNFYTPTMQSIPLPIMSPLTISY